MASAKIRLLIPFEINCDVLSGRHNIKNHMKIMIFKRIPTIIKCTFYEIICEN